MTLHIETHVREDAFRLFGFLSEDDRAWFVRLQAIQGVGAKVALAVLDILTPAEIMDAASNGDQAMVARASGVGPRLAARIVTELKGKPAPPTRYGGFASAPTLTRGPGGGPGGKAAAGAAVSSGPGDSSTEAGLAVRADAVSALMNLGLQEPDARAAVTNAYAGFDAAPALDALVKAALKDMGR